MTVDVPFNVIEDALIHRASKPDKSEQTAAAFTGAWNNSLRVADVSRFDKPPHLLDIEQQ